MSDKGEKAKQLLLQGKPYKEVSSETGLLYGSIHHHAKSLGLAKILPSYDWVEVQKYHNEGFSRLECVAKFGFCKSTWDSAVKRGTIVARDHRIPMEELLVKDSKRAPTHLKIRILNAKLIPEVCYACGITDEWNGKPITLWLDHKNGEGDDWRIENLRMVCPNCDSQSETFAGRNNLRKKKTIGK